MIEKTQCTIHGTNIHPSNRDDARAMQQYGLMQAIIRADHVTIAELAPNMDNLSFIYPYCGGFGQEAKYYTPLMLGAPLITH